MKKQLLLLMSLILAMVLNADLVRAQTPDPVTSMRWKTFNFDSLLDLIRDNNIKYIDNLVPLLPIEMRQNTILVYDSHAKMPHMASLAEPRMIFYSQDASLIISISKNPGAKNIAEGKDVVEVIRFNAVSGKFEIFVDKFDGKSEPFAQQNLAKIKNPARCTNCHGSNPRPLFHDYNGWPGVFGSWAQNGVAAVGTNEHQALKVILNKAKENKLGPRYRDLDFSGYYDFPAAFNGRALQRANGVLGQSGIAFKIQNYDGPRAKLMNDASFTPHLAFGMAIESLMHQRLAARLSKRPDFAKTIFPILFYLGKESGDEWSPDHPIAGKPQARTQAVYETLSRLNEKNEAAMTKIVAYLKAQVFEDNDKRVQALTKENEMSKVGDPRGSGSVLYTIFFPTISANKDLNNQSPDDNSAKKMLALMEVLGQKLGLTTMDISTSQATPTTGAFHLSRLGGMAVDEQYFQNLMAGFKIQFPDLIASYEQKSWPEVEAEALAAVKELFGHDEIVAPNKGILYNR